MRTIPVGTPGYAPKEQLEGRVCFGCDVYAVGMIGIQALTGIHPKELDRDPPIAASSSKIEWHKYAPIVSSGLSDVLDCMVCHNFRDRYTTAHDALEALQSIR